MDKEQYLNLIHLFLKGMVDKDRALLEMSLTRDACLYHISGRKESREEYIQDILDGTLNYYDYRIMDANEKTIQVKLLAKVYGGSKSWWTLAMDVEYALEEGKLKIKECKVRLGL